jgi:hypothetical protein
MLIGAAVAQRGVPGLPGNFISLAKQLLTKAMNPRLKPAGTHGRPALNQTNLGMR